MRRPSGERRRLRRQNGYARSWTPPSPRQKLVIFTEHRDTLNYLAERIATLLGRAQAVVTIHGGMGRGERRRAQEAFLHDPEVQVLVATDAAGEGINLQRAHLMVNYDLPWNPNRIEQRFGRIHRIGQTEVCHLWNLVAEETREGDVSGRSATKQEPLFGVTGFRTTAWTGAGSRSAPMCGVISRRGPMHASRSSSTGTVIRGSWTARS